VKGLEKALGGSFLAGRRTVIVGAGGAGRALAFGLREKGAAITVVNRTANRAKRLAADVGCDWRPMEDLDGLDAEILINCTSVGMSPKVDETPVDKKRLRPGMVVFDAVYNPLETRLLREAAEAGCRIVTGFDMFVGQAVGQFELWTGQRAPADLMADVLGKRLYSR
jgi:shikimate dehydrogenase